jgi:hypothetical protein
MLHALSASLAAADTLQTNALSGPLPSFRSIAMFRTATRAFEGLLADFFDGLARGDL